MKVRKGPKWLKHDFLEQLKQLLETNHVIEIDKLVDFDGKEQFIGNMLIREELAPAIDSDIERQDKLEQEERIEALRNVKYKNKLEEEEATLRVAMGL